ncbi:MAG: alpha/beta fold hydrolase [Candidatus Zixiibacteriota bacterium]
MEIQAELPIKTAEITYALTRDNTTATEIIYRAIKNLSEKTYNYIYQSYRLLDEFKKSEYYLKNDWLKFRTSELISELEYETSQVRSYNSIIKSQFSFETLQDYGSLAKREAIATFSILFRIDHLTKTSRLDPVLFNDRYNVFFATNRNRKNGYESIVFDGNRGNSLSYGTASISMNDERITKQNVKNPKKYFKITELKCQSEDKFWQDVSENLQSGTDGNKPLLIYIHGYNTNFEEAIEVGSQLHSDFRVKGTTIVFSWPSKGHFTKHPKDYQNCDQSREYLENFLNQAFNKAGAREIYIIGHSMGCRLLLNTCELIALKRRENAKKLVDHIVMAAPDIDQEDIEKRGRLIYKISRKFTLYVSTDDRLLDRSSNLFGEKRAGNDITILPEAVTIEAANIDDTFWGHSYFRNSSYVLRDIYYGVFEGVPPDKRYNLYEAHTPDNELYYILLYN